MKIFLQIKYDNIAKINYVYVNIFKDNNCYSDYFVLVLSANTFEGDYKVYTKRQKYMIDCLVEDNAIEVIEVNKQSRINNDTPKFGTYKIRLTQSKLLELI